MLRVAIVDDHPVAREGLRRILDHANDIEVVASVANPEELFVTGDDPPVIEADVVVLDLYLDADRLALDAIGRIAAQVPVLVMSASRHPGDVLAALQAGASGFLTKQASEGAYVHAIRTVATGQFHVSAQLADILQAEYATPSARPTTPKLSPREQETLSYIARGFTHTQTATRMKVSKATVDTYVARIRTKLHLGNKAELALAALNHVHPDHRKAL
jgi:DNA-binding NarL/FixJ family response regulator